MTTAGTVTVDVTGRDVNLVALLTQLDARMRETNQVGLQLATTTGTTFTNAQRTAANAAAQETAAIARSAAAMGDQQRAINVVNAGMANNAAMSDRALANLVKLNVGLLEGSTAAEQFGQAIVKNLASLVGPVAVVSTSLNVLKG